MRQCIGTDGGGFSFYTKEIFMQKFRTVACRLLSIACNLFIVCVEPIALPMSWSWGQEGIFTFYTEDCNIFAACVCALMAAGQLVCLFTGRELPRWLKQLKFVAASCLLLTFLTVVFVLAPMYGPDGLYVGLCTSSMLYHHLLNPLAAVLSLVLFEREPRLPRRAILWALVPTVLYGGTLLALNLRGTVDGPYPFLQVQLNGVPVTLAWLLGILLLNALYASVLWKVAGGRKEA